MSGQLLKIAYSDLPALFIKTSTRPYSALMSSKSLEIELSSSMSICTAFRVLRLLGNAASASLIAELAFSGLRPPSKIMYGLEKPNKDLTVSNPRPVFAPVIRITGLEVMAVRW